MDSLIALKTSSSFNKLVRNNNNNSFQEDHELPERGRLVQRERKSSTDFQYQWIDQKMLSERTSPKRWNTTSSRWNTWNTWNTTSSNNRISDFFLWITLFNKNVATGKNSKN